MILVCFMRLKYFVMLYSNILDYVNLYSMIRCLLDIYINNYINFYGIDKIIGKKRDLSCKD